jgi:hypothetical protein
VEGLGNCFRACVGERDILTGDKNTDFEETAKMVNGFLREKNKCPGGSSRNTRKTNYEMIWDYSVG